MSAPTASEMVHTQTRERSGRLLVSEVFGPTFQGEGPSLGRRCAFLRLGGCNLRCRWCDTPYTWDWSGRNGRSFDPRAELQLVEIAALWTSLCEYRVDTLIVSGGEPMLQQEQLLPLLDLASQAKWWIEVETAGTVAPRDEFLRRVSRINVSPKLKNSENHLEARYHPDVLDALQTSGKAIWKFVVKEADELDEVGALVSRHHLLPVYVMPEGTESDALLNRARLLSKPVLDRGWNLTLRMHILLYGDRRGV